MCVGLTPLPPPDAPGWPGVFAQSVQTPSAEGRGHRPGEGAGAEAAQPEASEKPLWLGQALGDPGRPVHSQVLLPTTHPLCAGFCAGLCAAGTGRGGRTTAPRGFHS